MNGKKLLTANVAILISLLLFGCDALSNGPTKTLVGGYVLLCFDENGKYYLFAPGELNNNDNQGVFEGTIEKIGWNQDWILAKVTKIYLGDKNGWYAVNLTTKQIVGPLQESELKTSSIFSKIKCYECADVMSGKVNAGLNQQQLIPLNIMLRLFFVFFCFLFVIEIIQVFICWSLYSCFKRIPQQFRICEQGLVWLLLIPFFNIVWGFFVYPSLAISYRNYFNSIGRTDTGDCGYMLGLAYCICVCCAVVPFIGILPGLAALMLLTIFLVKAWNLRSQIPVNNSSVIRGGLK
jgi:hypothetical protein